MWRKRSIFDEMFRMHEEMERMFDAVFDRPTYLQLEGSKNKHSMTKGEYRRPLCNMYDKDKEVICQFEIPGVDKQDIKVNVTDDSVEISVEKNVEIKKQDDKKGIYRYERGYTNFYRSMALPDNVDSKNAVAEYKNGILELKIPKLDKPKKSHKQIEVK